MSGNSSSSPVQDDDDIFAAMDALSSPLRPGPSALRKRPRNATDDGSNSDDNDDDLPPAPGGADQSAGDATQDNSGDHDGSQQRVNQNATMFAKRLASRKKLQKDQEADIEAFASDTPGNRQTKLYIQLLAIENQLTTIRSRNSATFQVTKDLERNLKDYAVAVLLSTHISAYKGNVPKDHLLAIVKKYDFGLPPDIEKRLADWAKVTGAAQYTLTQARSSFKKMVGESIQPEKNYSIYMLAKKLTANTCCSVTSKLCARVALFRREYAKGSAKNFWDCVDDKLEKIQTRANYDAEKITKAFKKILSDDRSTYGVDDGTEIDDDVEEWQQIIDDSIEAAQRITRPAAAAPKAN